MESPAPALQGLVLLLCNSPVEQVSAPRLSRNSGPPSWSWLNWGSSLGLWDSMLLLPTLQGRPPWPA